LTGIANFNAIPWANVSIDGSPRGQTPLGNVTLPVGTHEVLFSHPELGTLRRSITITADKPTRLSVTIGPQP
jgi:serine/threonine-protein kinase